MKKDERRLDSRSRVNSLACTTTQEGQVILLELVDVSAGGVRVRLGTFEFNIGDELSLELDIDQTYIDTLGRVVNLTDEEAGLEFVDLADDDRLVIETYISSTNW